MLKIVHHTKSDPLDYLTTSNKNVRRSKSIATARPSATIQLDATDYYKKYNDKDNS